MNESAEQYFNNNETITAQVVVKYKAAISTWLLMGFALTLAVVIIVSNSLTITIIMKTEALQTLSNMYTTSLAFVDLLVGVSMIPFAGFFVPYVHIQYFMRYPHLCVFMNSFSMSATLLSVLHLMLISIDRCSCIVAPLKYITHANRKRTAIIIACTWIFCIFYLVLPLVVEDRVFIPKCDTTIVMPKWYVVYCNASFYGTASVVTVIMYATILHIATRRRKNVKSLQASTSTPGIVINNGKRQATSENKDSPAAAAFVVGGGDAEGKGEKDTTTTQDVRMKSKGPRASSFDATLKSAKFFATVFGVFFMSITPAVVSMSLDFYEQLPRPLYNACSLIAATNSAANFFIFYSRNEVFRKSMYKTFGRSKSR